MAKQKPKTQQTRRIENRKAKHHYQIIESVEAGIALKGSEVKSLRAGHVSLDEAYARLDPQGIVLINLQIQPYSHAGRLNHNIKRVKRLLLHKHQIKKFAAKVTLKGQTLVPLAIYFAESGFAKVELALAKGRTMSDKRENSKERDAKREIDRAMRRR